MTEGRVNETPQPSLHAERNAAREIIVRNDISKRLKGVCKDLPEAEFQKLIGEMVRRQLKSEQQD